MLNKELLLSSSSKPLEYYSTVDTAPMFGDNGEMYFMFFAWFKGYDIKWNLDGVVFPLGDIHYDESYGELALVGSDITAKPKKGITIKVTNVETGGTSTFVFDGNNNSAFIKTDNIGLISAKEITVTFDPKPV